MRIEKTHEGIGNVGGGVEEGQPTRQLASTVEGGQVVDDQREETRLRGTEEEAQGKDASEVMGGSAEERHGAKGEHEDREDSRGAELLSEDGDGRREEHEGDEEDGHEEVVLAVLEVEV